MNKLIFCDICGRNVPDGLEELISANNEVIQLCRNCYTVIRKGLDLFRIDWN